MQKNKKTFLCEKKPVERNCKRDLHMPKNNCKGDLKKDTQHCRQI